MTQEKLPQELLDMVDKKSKVWAGTYLHDQLFIDGIEDVTCAYSVGFTDCLKHLIEFSEWCSVHYVYGLSHKWVVHGIVFTTTDLLKIYFEEIKNKEK